MDIPAESANTLSPTKRALLALKELQAKLDTLERAANEPIAIIGLGCRFPGGSDDPAAFWRLLHDGVDAIDEVPPDRWDADVYYDPDPEARGMMRTRYGGFLSQRDSFDTSFFRISPREAASLDPQQRLLLEVSWEALEHAGIAPDSLFGSTTGVFVGMTNFDHSISLLRQGREQIDVYFGTGSALSVAAGRLSYLLGLTGPSMVIDTACSSSLVALHLACQSLRNRECDAALAGGVNMLSAPEVSINLSQAGMLAPDGRCKTFDASADGYTRGEGCGMIVLKRLSDALATGDPILALICGSAVNQDGPSGGLTVPNGPSQEQVIRQALERSGYGPADIQYIEAHGTGTSLGDPIEIGALAKVFGPDRPADRPLIVGSVKTNIGHLESAAGIAGLIKVVLAMGQGIIPPHLHFKTPNPHIPWQNLPLMVPTTAQAWERADGPRLAGISSFGFSGTNAHVVIEEAPVVEQPQVNGDRSAHLLTLSATSEVALRALAERYREYLAHSPQPSIGDVCFTAHIGRSHSEHRLSVVGASGADLQEGLTAFLTRQEFSGAISGKARRNAQPKVAFLFTGQGSQYIGMGRELYETEPSFRRTLDRCDELLRPYLEQPLLSVLYPADGAESPLNETAYTQAALFALEYALAELWQSWGIIPAAVLGHSVGEYVAACVAGVFSLEDGLRLIAERGRLMQSLPTSGAMAAVFADEARVAAAIRPYAQSVSIAAINSPQNCVISGDSESIREIRARLEAEGIETRPLRVSQAFHSPLIEPMLAAFEQVAATVQYSAPRIPIISNLSGQLEAAAIATPGYWTRHARQPVRFAAGIQALRQQEIDLCVEIGPEPTLLALGRQVLPDEPIQWLPTLRRKAANWRTILQSLGALYARGAAIDWTTFDRSYARRRIALPTYPFQRQRYWLDIPTTASQGAAMSEREARTPIPSNNHHAASNGASPIGSSFDSILATIRGMIGAVLQIAPSSLDPQTTFIDLGADSIVLMELIRKIEQTYGLQLAIRQLFEELGTPQALAAYVDQHLPPEWHAAQAAQQTPAAPVVEPSQPAAPIVQPQPASIVAAPLLTAPGAGPVGSGEVAPAASVVERVLRDQIQAMSSLLSAQLDLLRGVPASEPAAHIAQPAAHIAQPAPVAARAAPPRAETSQSNGSTAFTTGQATGIQTRTKDLTPQQQRYLDTFIARYNQRTRKSKEFTQAHRPVWADIRSTMGFRQETKELCYTLVAERSSGAHMWDIDGNRYIDVAMGFGVHLFGHSPAFIGAAIEDQLRQGIHIGPQSNLVGEVSQLISDLTGMERVTYCNSGTEAVMTAIRLARAATGRTRIAIFSDAYHGHSDHTLAISKMVNGARQTIPWVPGVPESVVGEVLVLPYGDPASLDVIRAHLHELAAVLVEPVQSRRPNLQPAEFLRQVRQMTAEADVTLIFDEIITGFRIHPGGAQAHFGIKADLATYGKIVGGGIPIGVVAGQAQYLDRIDGGMWQYGDDSFPPVAPSFAAGTFCKHPLAMAAARAVLLKMKQDGPALQQQISQRTARMAETLDRYFQAESLPISVAHFGSIFRFTQGNNFSYLFQPLEMDLLFYHLIERGIYLWEGRTCFLSTEHTDADVDTLIQSVQASVADLRAGGFFASDPPKQSNGSSGSSTPRSMTGAPAVSTPGERQVLHTFPLTKAQQQLWALAQMGDDGMLSSKVTGALELRGPLNSHALHQAIQMVVDRHETLRSTISAHGDVQQVWSSLLLDLPLVDLSGMEQAERETAIAAWFEAESRKPFDFAAGPLFRTTLIRLEPQLHVLVWATHHIVVDGWSVTVILRELGRLYTDACGGSAAQLTPPFQFREYIAWQDRRMQTAEMAASESYWLNQFATSIPALNLPTDQPRPPIKTYTGNRMTRRFDARFGREIKQASQESGATIFMLLLAVYNVLLHQISGQDDLVVGVPTAGRSLDQGDAIVGYCTNVIPIRSRASGDQRFIDYLKQFRSVLFDAYQHQDYPFAELIDRLNLRRDPGASPLVSVIFNLEPRVPVQKAFDLELDLITPFISFTAYDLDLNITEVGDEFILDFDYNSDLFEKATIARFLDYFEGLLRQFMRDANQPIAAVFQALRDQADKQEQQAARERFKKLRQERARRSASGPFPA